MRGTVAQQILWLHKLKNPPRIPSQKWEESSADFVYRVGSFSAVSFSSAKNISTFF